MKKLCLLWCVLLLVRQTAAFAINADWSIWQPETASATERYAAQEFQTVFEKMTNQRLPIIHTPVPPENRSIRIATASRLPELPPDLSKLAEADPQDDCLGIGSKGDNLYLTGNNPRSALYAVYTFFTDHCGVRWLWPGDSGEFIPRRDVVTVDPELCQIERAAFRYRGIHWIITHYDHDTETWMSRNRLNIMRSDPVDGEKWRREWNDERLAKGLHMMFSTHNIHLEGNWFQEHPELFALVNGVRDERQLCWSNPEVDKIMIDRFAAAVAEYPEVEIVSLFPADSTVICQCSQCSARPATDLWFAMLQRIVDGVSQRYPGRKFATIAYQDYRETPGCDVKDLTFVEYCMYNRCYVHPFGACKVNDSALRGIDQWRAKGVPVGVYGYEFDIFSPDMFVPFYPMLADEFTVLRDRGVIGYITEGRPDNVPAAANEKTRPYMRNRLGYYLVAKLLWNPDLSWTDAVRDFCVTAYGPAGDAMYRYYTGLADAWTSMSVHFTYYSASPVGAAGRFLSPERIAAAEHCLADAEQAAGTIADPDRRTEVLRQIDIDRGSFSLWLEFYHRFLTERDAIGLTIPRAGTALDFTGALKLPAFRNRDGRNFHPTDAWLNWDDKAIYLKVFCRDPASSRPTTPKREHDGPVWLDECLEIFLGLPGDPDGQYRHWIVNAAGSRYEAVVRAPDDFIVDWNPDWTAAVKRESDGWTATITIPFAALPFAPKAQDKWSFQLIRSVGPRGDTAASGFPTTGYHDRNAFGEITFGNRQESCSALLFAPTTEREMNQMRAGFEEAGYQLFTLGASDYEGEANAGLQTLLQVTAPYDVIMLRLPGVALSGEFCRRYLLPRLQTGTLVLISSYGDLPLDNWFGMPELKLTWSGWECEPERHNYGLREGEWLHLPHELGPVFRNRPAPCSGYLPKPDTGWETLAAMKRKDGTEFASLLVRPFGRGLLVVTTSDFGFAGGNVIFGEGEGKQDAVKLIDNLLRAMK